MSGTPRRQPRCSKCYKRRKLGDFAPIHSAKYVGINGTGIEFKCTICGHEWVSYSIGAYRIARYHKVQEAIDRDN